MLLAIILVILIAIALVLLLGKRQRYTYDDDGIVIHGSVNKKIFYRDMLEARKISWDSLGPTMKFGLRMPGTLYGSFHFHELGEVVVSVNDDRKMVFIRTRDAHYIISPEDPAAFIKHAGH
ncbi:PH domain-containing protein [Polluticoccus soli]|uniref:PH domain-containing protein n=1 Tax=Polluticoccus soli TaxID=3034150 RepID=UPI0023E31F2F|nr:PH domain-containing protein [Flavipsychrobacter sp. JY13-12]